MRERKMGEGERTGRNDCIEDPLMIQRDTGQSFKHTLKHTLDRNIQTDKLTPKTIKMNKLVL